MHRPKQQALAFLLGALLVGGVVGFSADRVMGQKELSFEERRKALYDDLGLAAAQRGKLDSVFDATNCELRPVMDSIKSRNRAQMIAVLTPEQRVRLEARRKDHDARHASSRKRAKTPCPK